MEFLLMAHVMFAQLWLGAAAFNVQIQLFALFVIILTFLRLQLEGVLYVPVL